MPQATHSGATGNQGPRQPAQPAAPAAQSASPSPTSAPALLTAAQAARVLGVGERTFHSLRHEPWMPKAISLGPRLTRWSRAELEAAYQRAPRQEVIPEPPATLAEGRRKRIERIKAGGAQ